MRAIRKAPERAWATSSGVCANVDANDQSLNQLSESHGVSEYDRVLMEYDWQSGDECFGIRGVTVMSAHAIQNHPLSMREGGRGKSWSKIVGCETRLLIFQVGLINPSVAAVSPRLSRLIPSMAPVQCSKSGAAPFHAFRAPFRMNCGWVMDFDSQVIFLLEGDGCRPSVLLALVLRHSK